MLCCTWHDDDVTICTHTATYRKSLQRTATQTGLFKTKEYTLPCHACHTKTFSYRVYTYTRTIGWGVLQCGAVWCSVLLCAYIFGVNTTMYLLCMRIYIHTHPGRIGDKAWCPTSQQIATHCNTLHRSGTHCNTLQHTATHCNTLQHTATHSHREDYLKIRDACCLILRIKLAAHCNTLQHTAIHYYTCTTSWRKLQPTATQTGLIKDKSHMLPNFARRVSVSTTIFYHTATPCNTLQHTATQTGLAEDKGHIHSFIKPALSVASPNTLQLTATPCNTLHHSATHTGLIKDKQYMLPYLAYQISVSSGIPSLILSNNSFSPRDLRDLAGGPPTATHCNTLQHVL